MSISIVVLRSSALFHPVAVLVPMLQRPVPTLMGKDGTLERPHRRSHAGAWERDVAPYGSMYKKHNTRVSISRRKEQRMGREGSTGGNTVDDDRADRFKFTFRES
ncbi:MAG: hypothetical protein GY801_47375 [bacterium]|nr:hypothetical protein [bacterium]